MLFYSSYGDLEGLRTVAAEAEEAGKFNVAYEAASLTGDAERCVDILLKSNRVAEAAFFARAYAPSLLQKVMKPWSEALQQKKLPFQPEDILKLDEYAEVVQENMGLEEAIKRRYYEAPKEAASEYETVKAQYYNDTLAD